MCSSSSASSSNKILMEIDADDVATKLRETIIEASPPYSPQNQKNYFLVLPAELIKMIFTALDDHDSFQNVAFLSKHMHFIVRPYLMAKRKKILDELCHFRAEVDDSELTNLERCKELIRREEKFLKRVLRTNEDLTCSAHNLPIERVQHVHAEPLTMAHANSSSAHALPTSELHFGKPRNPFFVLDMLGLTGGHEDQLAVEQRAYQLLQVALRHCYEFSRFYNDTIEPSINDMWYHRISKDNVETLKAGFAYRIFEEFLRKYRVLSMFTDVHWPNEMPEKARRQMAKQYAEQNAIKAPRREHGMGRMHEMRNTGRVGNPYTTKPLWVRFRRRSYRYRSPSPDYYDYYGRRYSPDYYGGYSSDEYRRFLHDY